MTSPEKRQPWLNSTVLGIGLASLFSDVGHEMATAVLPALLTSLGLGSGTLGLIEGVSDGAASFAGATRGWHVMLGRLIGWSGRGMRSPVRNVLLTEASTPETYGRVFGLERAMDSAGAMIGPLIALFLVGRIDIRPIFTATLIPAILAATCISFLVREKPHAPDENATLLGIMKALPMEYRKFLFGVGIAGLGDFSNTLLILWATQAWTPIFGIVRASALAMAFYVGFNFIYSLTCYLGGAVSDRFPKPVVLATGYLVAIIPTAAMGYVILTSIVGASVIYSLRPLKVIPV